MATASGLCEAAPITMRTRRAVESVAYSSALILRADQLQYELDEGPCLDAVWTDGVFVVPDLRATAGGRGGRPARPSSVSAVRCRCTCSPTPRWGN